MSDAEISLVQAFLGSSQAPENRKWLENRLIVIQQEKHMGKKPITTPKAPIKRELTKAQESDIGVVQERGRRLLNFIGMMHGPQSEAAATKVQEAIGMVVQDITARNGEPDGADLV